MTRWVRRLAAAVLAIPALAFAADPQIASLVDTPDPVAAGGEYVYSLRADNDSTDPALNTRLRFTVPAGATFVSFTPSTAACVATSATVVDCDLGTLGARGEDTRNFTFTWRARGPGPSIVSASAVISADNDVNSANNTQNATTTVTAGADLVLAATGTPSPVVAGGQITYALTVSNPVGPNDSGALVLTTNLAPGVSYVSASGSGWTCGAAGQVVTCTRPGPNPVGVAIPPVSVVGTVTIPSGTLSTSASVAPAPIASGGVADPVQSNNAVVVNTPVVSGADLSVVKVLNQPDPVVAGSNVTFVIRPRNAGPATATNVVVSDPLPAGWTYVSAGGPNWSCSVSSNSVSCTRPQMPPGAADDITIVATAPAVVAPNGTGYTNTATVSSATADPVPTNNSSSVNVTVRGSGADLRIFKLKSPNPVAVGGLITSTIQIVNQGPLPATGPMRVTEVLNNEEFVSYSGSGWTCTATGNVVVCDHPSLTLAVGDYYPELKIVTRALATGTATNEACTSNRVPAGAGSVTPRPPVEGDPNPSNDCATAQVTVSAASPDLAITKTTSTPTGGDKTVSASEDSVTFTLVVTNLTPNIPATGVRVDDQLPAQVAGTVVVQPIPWSVSAGSNAVFSCGFAFGVVTCTQTSGSLKGGESLTVPITMRRPLAIGTFGNTAEVSNTVEGDANSANNRASDTVTIVGLADVEVRAKTVTPNPVLAGQPASYVITYRNNGPGVAEGVKVRDSFAFPAGDSGVTVTSISSSKTGSSCNVAVGTVLAPGGTTFFDCTIGTLAVGEEQTIVLGVRPNFQTGNPSRSIPNTATISATTAESSTGSDNGNNSQTATLNVQPAQIDLLVNKTDLVDPVRNLPAGTFLDYRVRVTSNGPSLGTNVQVTESMRPPANKRVKFICDTTGFGSGVCNPTTLCPGAAGSISSPGQPLPNFICSVPAGDAVTGVGVGTLQPGQSKDIFLRFEAVDVPQPGGDVFNNVATVSANEPDSLSSNNTESEQTTTRQSIDLKVTKTSSVPTVSLLQPFDWTVGVTNGGPGNSLQTDLTDTLPPEVEVTGTITWTKTKPVANGTCTRSGQTLTCALGQLDAGGAVTITVPVRVTTLPASGTVTNTATVDTDPNKTGGVDVPAGDTTATSTVNVVQSSLAGTVFDDRDRTGANGGTPQGAAVEPRISGVSVRLTGNDAWGNPVDLTTTTDANGNYKFTGLGPAGASGYTITETQPTAYVNGPVNPPIPATGGTYAGGGSSGNSRYSAIPLAAATDGVNYNFPELRRVSLSGFVYLDANLNGTRDAGSDPAIAGATVRLLDATTLAQVSTTTTDASGRYEFTALDPLRVYTLEEPLPATPAGLTSGPVNPGLIGGAACASGCTAQPNTPATGTDRIASIDLSSGNDGTQFNFGELQRATISGTVYIDRDRDNTIDPQPTDGRIPGVTLSLYTGGSCSGVPVATTTTDASGNYQFTTAAVGLTYTVCETQPAGYGEGAVNPGTNGTNSAANAITITNLPSAGSANNQFGERVGSLAGSVYLDANNDGLRQGGESGFNGITVTLTGTDAGGAAVNRQVTTDASGNYSFGDLVGGTYVVTEQVAQPVFNGTTTLNGKTSAGSAGGTATPVTTTPSAVSAITLGGGIDATAYNFGEILPVSIAGTVFLDENGNGTQGGAEPGIGGVPLVITGTNDLGVPVTVNVTTAADGSYSVTGLRPGTYTVTEPTQPPGTRNGTTTAGTAGGTATPVATVPSAISGIPLTTPNTASTGNNFAELPPPPTTTISGTVYIDRDGDGQPDPTPTDGRLPGVTLTVYSGTSCSGVPVATTTTDANGNYSFSGLLVGGTYTICETQPSGYGDGGTNPGTGGTSTTPNAITITGLPAGGSANNQFGEKLASIAGSVYLDANNDGNRQAADTGLAGVTVRLTGTDVNGGSVNLSTTTDASGNYRFGDLLAGTYKLTEQTAQPVAGTTTTLNGKTTAGSAGGTATAVTATPSAISAVTLAGGTAATGYLFGEILPVGLSGTVFADTDNDGVQAKTDEPGLPNVALVITGTDDTGASVTRNVTTGSDGSYSVTGLRPGTYTVTEPTQPPDTSNGKTTAGSAGGTATPVSTVPSAISGIPLTTPGTTSTANNFGEIPTSGTISGRVWTDTDNDGRIDSGETGIAGVTIELSGPVTRTTTTDANGNYSFTDLPPGNYTVREPTQPTGTVNGKTVAGSTGGTATAPATTPSRITTIPLGGVGATSTGNNFGELPAGSIAGTVWNDLDGDGVRDTTEPGLPSVTLVLTGTDDLGRAVDVTVTTGPDGSYTFPNLRPGTYTVTEPTQPDGTTDGATLPGSLGGTATPKGSTPSAISGIVLPPGGQSVRNDFGEVADSPDMKVSKRHDGAMTVGRQGSFTINVGNTGKLSSSGNYTVSDRLPTGMTLVATPTGRGWACVGGAGATSFSCTSSAVIAAGGTNPNPITALVDIAASAAAASPVSNAVLVEGGGEITARGPTETERDRFTNTPKTLPLCGTTPARNACRDDVVIQVPASVSGTVWFDGGSSSRLLDAGDTRLSGWTVEVVDRGTNTVVARTTSASDGTYRVTDLTPGIELAVRFRHPTSGIVFGYPVNGETAPGSSGAACVAGLPPPGTPSSCVSTGVQPQLVVVLASGQLLPQQSLPVDPSGVVYDSIARTPVPGSVVTLAPVGTCDGWSPRQSVVGGGLGGYTVNGSAVSMTVGSDGFYQFLLSPNAPARCTFGLTVTPPSGYSFVSTVIPPQTGALSPSGGAGTTFNVQPQAAAPTGSVGTATQYWLQLTTGSAGANVVHNHIPLDPTTPGAVGLFKTGDRSQAEIGDSVRYSVTVQLSAGVRPAQTTVVDRLPAGFTYIKGTAMVDGKSIADPQGGVGPTLAFNLGAFPSGSNTMTLQYRVRIGVGAQEGDGINKAKAFACQVPATCVGPGFDPVPGATPTNESQFRVRVFGGVFGTEACFAGSLFVDCNGNHVKDPEEIGIPGVRLYMEDGTTIVSDSEGKFSLCGVTPQSHVLKVDPTTLPTGSRLTTTSSRNLGDANSIWLDAKNGELARADFAEGSCSNRVIEQVKARRALGEVRVPEVEKGPALRFDSKPPSSPQQGTDSANQPIPRPRSTDTTGGTDAKR